MKFSTFVAVALVSLMLGFSTAPAEAKRLGGGMSFGKSYKYNRTPKPAQAPSQQTPAAGQAAGQGAAGKSAPGRGLMGPLAGLAAGGLLAALFFGGAFEGIQILDILILAALAFFVISLLRRRSAQVPAPAGAPGGQWSSEQPGEPAVTQRQSVQPTSPNISGFAVPEIGSGLKGESLSVNPDWFSETAFMSEVGGHFRDLQAHWDRGDMGAIAEYVTPEMLANLTAEREALLNQPHTEVVRLESQLLDLIKDGNKIVAAILFSGLINEDRAAQPTPFAEVWHVEHDAHSPEGDWLLAGIIQHQ